MKQTILTLVLALALVATTATATAIYKSTDNDSFVRIYNMLIDTDNVVDYKFTDGKVTCYGSYSKGSGLTSTAISCVK